MFTVLAVPALWREYRWVSNTGESAPAAEGLVGSLLVLSVAMMALVSLITAILVLKWIHRAAWNARELGATWMKHTPGWAIGWYFIPIASLWKPYQAMKEIWHASHRPSRPMSDDEGRGTMLALWWGLWIVTFFGAGGVSWTASAETAETLADVVRELLRIPLTLVMLSIVTRIHSVQMAHYRTSGSSSTAVP